jgi:hypothetical protein
MLGSVGEAKFVHEFGRFSLTDESLRFFEVYCELQILHSLTTGKQESNPTSAAAPRKPAIEMVLKFAKGVENVEVKLVVLHESEHIMKKHASSLSIFCEPERRIRNRLYSD